MSKIILFETIEESSEIRVEAEPYGSVTFFKDSETISVDFHDDVPWNHYQKFFKLMKRAVGRTTKSKLLGGEEYE
jgi:hypothetical protein